MSTQKLSPQSFIKQIKAIKKMGGTAIANFSFPHSEFNLEKEAVILKVDEDDEAVYVESLDGKVYSICMSNLESVKRQRKGK